MRAGGEAMVSASLRRQGILVTKVKKRRMRGGSSIKPKDIAIFTRQLATMMQAGVPLLQAFDIVARGSTNPNVTRLLTTSAATWRPAPACRRRSASIRCTSTLSTATWWRRARPGGILETLLDRLAIYQEKTEAIKSKIKSALMYPIAVLVVAFVVLAVIMIFVIPAFKDVFTSFGADRFAPTLSVIAMSEFFVNYWWLIFGVHGRRHLLLHPSVAAKREDAEGMDRLLLRVPIFGDLIYKSVIARWTRTLSTMFAAGVPLVEALDSVGGASGNSVFAWRPPSRSRRTCPPAPA